MLNQNQLSRVDLNLLVVFHTVLEERHVGRSAARLHLTPSAVSHSLRRLRSALNDPLFLKTPAGVEPTARARDLAPEVAALVARASDIFGLSDPFEPSRSQRRFVIGGVDATISSIAGPLAQRLRTDAPLIDICFLQILPTGRAGSRRGPWSNALEQVERRLIDIALLPLGSVDPEFEARALYKEEFVVTARCGHPFAQSPTLTAYCAAEHLLVSISGEPFGFVDAMLAERGLRRRVAMTAPSFMTALPIVAQSDLLAAMPRRLVEANAARFGLVHRDLPLKRAPDLMQAIVLKHSVQDPGIAWLLARLVETASAAGKKARKTPKRRRATPPRARG